MKKLLYLGMMLIACASVSLSHGQSAKGDPQVKAKKATEKMKSDLEFTDGQYEKVYDINVKYAQKMNAFRDSSAAASRSDRATALRDLKKQKNEELKMVLTDTQMQKYRKMQKEKHNAAKDRHRKKRNS